jgi:flavin reductase (DIM6/NTAB) family NADH-FMN oxidoreductase RutF
MVTSSARVEGDSMTSARVDMPAFETIMADVETPSYIVTARSSGDRAGCLVALAARCGIDPPRFGVWLSTLNHTYRVALSAPTLVVHLLRDGDGDLARRFGGDTGDEVDKFAGIEWYDGPDVCPVIDRLDWFAGSIVDRVPSGDHVGFLLAPTAGRCRRPGRRQLSYAEVGDIEPGHPLPGR